MNQIPCGESRVPICQAARVENQFPFDGEDFVNYADDKRQSGIECRGACDGEIGMQELLQNLGRRDQLLALRLG